MNGSYAPVTSNYDFGRAICYAANLVYLAIVEEISVLVKKIV